MMAEIEVKNLLSETETSGAVVVDDDDGRGMSSEDAIPDRSLCHLVGITAFAFVYGLTIPTFCFVAVLMESANVLQLIIFCGVSQLLSPVVGFFSDRCTSIYGRGRPFLVISGSIGVLSLFILQRASAAKYRTLYHLVLFVFMLSLNIMYVAYLGTVTDQINEKQRGMANGLMGALTMFGTSVGYVCFSYYLELDSGYYFYIFILLASIFISVLAFTERPFVAQSFTANWTWKEIMKKSYRLNPIKHCDFFLVLISRTLYYMGLSVRPFLILYFRDIIGSDDLKADVSYLVLVGYLSGAVFCVPTGLLSSRLGRKAVIYFCSGLIIFAHGIFIIFRTRFWVILGGVIYGIGYGTYLSVDYAITCDTIPSKNNTARYLGIWIAVAFIGTLVGSIIIGVALEVFGDKGNINQDEGSTIYDHEGYVVILIIASICIFVGAVTVIPVQSIKQKKH